MGLLWQGSPKLSVPTGGKTSEAKRSATALWVAEVIFPLGDRDVVNREELVEPAVGEFGSELAPE